MSIAQSLRSRTIAVVLAIAVALTGAAQAPPAWAVAVTTGSPTISGNAGVGSTLTVSEGTWDPAETTFTYQWTRDDVAITDATASTYTTVLADVGTTIKAIVTGTADGFDPDSATSTNSITPVLNTFVTATDPTITGTKKVGSTLTANISGWDPSAGVTYTYQWSRTVDSVASDITDATNSTYVLTADDLGATITVTIVGSKSGYDPVTTTSAETSTVVANTFATTGTATIDYTTTDIGDLLTANEGTWSPSADVTYTYQWRRKVGLTTSDIADATDATYALTLADMGNSIRVVVTAHLAGYADTSATSALTSIPLLSFATDGLPLVTGDTVPGGELTVDPTGVFTPSADTTYTYRWFKGGVVIAGETADTYTVRSGDIGASITAEVTAHTTGYDNELLISDGITVTAADLFTLFPKPVISGLAQVGRTLTATAGTWAPEPDFLSFQWRRNGVDIEGATDTTYELSGDDASAVISVAVTARKAGFEVKTRMSAATSAVLTGVFTAKPVPTISGTARVGQTLTANADGWSPTPDGFTYAWLRDGVAIPGATTATYALASADRGSFISVRVTPVKTGYTLPNRTSATTAAVVTGTLTSVAPVIDDETPHVGDTLHVATSGWTSGVSFTYQWMRDGTAISGATAASYVVTGDDAGTKISVTASGTKTGFSAASATSLETALVPASSFTGGATPTISGDPSVGSTLSVDFGTLSPTPTSVTYEWTSDGTVVGTGSTYTATASDLDASIVVTIIATKVGYTTWESDPSNSVVVDFGTIELLTAPTILGTARLGRTLTGTVGTWRHTPDSFDYQWYADGEPIDGATTTQFQPTEAEVGTTLAFEITAHKSGFNDEVALSAATAEVRFAAFNLQPVPTISGTVKVNSTLTAVPGSWSPTAESYVYQWTRGGVPIPGASSETYLLVPDDAGELIRVIVTGEHVGYEGDPKTSLPTVAVAVGTFTAKPAPTINDTTPIVGQTLTATTPAWTPTTDSFAYQWNRTLSGVTTAISGATSATYEVVAGDLGATLTVTSTGVLGGYASTSMTSAATSSVASGVFSASPVPTISGTAAVGETLTAITGTWTPTATLGYQWKRDGQNISGATTSTYALQHADADKFITVAVTGTRSSYSSITRTSAATVAVEPLTFEDVVTPTIDGDEVVGNTLRASTGTWSPVQDRFEYQWFCGEDELPHATGATYTLVGADAECVITVEVTAVKLGYRSVTLVSSETSAIGTGTFETTPTPVITGALKVGKLLTADPGTWSPSADLAYQWTRDGVDIDDATDSTYRLTADDLDAAIGVYVVGSAIGYYDSNAIASEETATIALGVIAPAPVPTVTGIAKVGQTLELSAGTWGGVADDVTLDYQWNRTIAGDTTEIDGATDDTYELVADDLGATITVTVTGSMVAYTDQVKTSVATGIVTKGTFASPHAPTITGTVAVGKTLTASMGDWSPNDPTFAYQWFRGKLPIAGATNATYVPLATDLGTKISVTVIATEPGFVTVSGTTTKSLVALGTFDSSPTPTITSSGTFAVGATLTANAGVWSPSAPGTTLTYQWFRAGVAITGQTSATYLLQGGDAGNVVTVAVTATRLGFVTVTRTSAATATIANATFTAAPTPVIIYPNGDPPKVGETLRINPGEWAPLTFPSWTPTAGRISYSYQWKRGGVAIDGATGSSYQLLAADLGTTITVDVTGALLGYTSVTKTSAASTAVDIGAFNPSPDPTVIGVRAVGSTLTASTGTWGPVTPSFTYRWKRDGTPIGSADQSTYTLTPDDLGASISVTVRATATAFATSNRTSSATSAIVNGTFVAGTPAISGTMGVGATLTANTGTWSPNPELATFAYQWLKNGANISGATSATYTPPASDVGAVYSVRVTATRDGFTTMSALSATRTVVKGTFANTVKPAISGLAAVGQTLTATSGTWTPVVVGSTFAYQWIRGTTAISGATASTYVLTSMDSGKKISVRVTVSAVGYTNGVIKSVATTIP